MRFSLILILFSLLLPSCKPKEGPLGVQVGDEIVETFAGMVVKVEGSPTMVVTDITKDKIEISRLGRVVHELTYQEYEFLINEKKLGNWTKAREEENYGVEEAIENISKRDFSE